MVTKNLKIMTKTYARQRESTRADARSEKAPLISELSRKQCMKLTFKYMQYQIFHGGWKVAQWVLMVM